MNYEAELERLRAENEELNNFVFRVAHDLKSPIKSIQSYVDVIKQKDTCTYSGETSFYLDTISTICSNSVNVIEDLLRLSTMETNQEFQDCYLLPIIQNAVLALKDRIDSHGAQVIIDDDCKDKIIYCDPNLITNLLQNLIDNGIKFNKSAQPIIRIGVLSPYILNNKVTIFVEDNGIGIPRNLQAQIFGMFNRGTKDYEGSGIGLSIVKKIIEIHEENIWIDSKIDLGSTFYFNLRKGRTDGKESITQRKRSATEV